MMLLPPSVAGSNLRVLVCSSKTEASKIMDNPRAAMQLTGGGAWGGVAGKLRIWPLDCISAPEVSASQRRALEELGPGNVTRCGCRWGLGRWGKGPQEILPALGRGHAHPCGAP